MGDKEAKMMITKSLIMAAFCLTFALAGFDVCRNTYTAANCGGSISKGYEITNGNYVCFKSETGSYIMITTTTNGTCNENTTYALKQYTDGTCKTVKTTFTSNSKMSACVLGQMKFTCGKCSKKTETCTTKTPGTSAKFGSGTCAASGSSTLLPSLSFMAIVTALLVLKN